MELVMKLLTVLGLGAVELWAAIPIGLVLKVPPVLTASVAAIGAELGVVAVVLVGERARTWLVRRHRGENRTRQQGHVSRIWHRYGVVELGLLAPLLCGAPLGAALGITLGAPTKHLLFWISVGIILGSIGLTLAIALGLVGIAALRH